VSDTAVVGENVEIIQTTTGRARSAFTWSVVIAGALAAWAVSFIFIALGTGIGLSITSPYSGASSTAMTIGGAIWLVFAQTVAYTVGGYIAGRLRIRDHNPGPETKFRDGAHGFMAWVIGVGIASAVLLWSGAVGAHIGSQTAASAAQAAAAMTDEMRKAAAYFSFWSFIALLFGAVAATLAGILGGELRDEA
jgi:hypothetical protein